MHEYTASLLWFSTWPAVIYLGYRFVRLNVTHFQKLESIEFPPAEEKKS